jgi:coenzyme F420-0:L-glutamate ligase/coenzyme F420-1:gamma-L-glutamate ligase
MTVGELTIVPIWEVPLIKQGDDLPSVLLEVLEKCEFKPEPGDILVVTHTIVSIAEGCVFRKSEIEVCEESKRIAQQNDRSPTQVEVALRNAKRILRETPVLITETKHGLITDYSGVDESNAPPGTLMTLPADPDKSAASIFQKLSDGLGFSLPVIISDTHGRPWRRGAVNLAVGVAGFSPFVKNAGKKDLYGKQLRSSLVCLADEIAAAAELVMGQADEGIPLALVRGIHFEGTQGSAAEIIRDPEQSLFD